MSPLRGQITKHLSWGEATVTEHREFLRLQNPPLPVQENIRLFAERYFEPARAVLGPIRVNSLYRCPSLNRAIKGAKNSRHVLGLAADIYPLHRTLLDSMKCLIALGIYDQVIWEYGRWIHIGAPISGVPRLEKLMILEPGKYEQFCADDPRVLGGNNAGPRNVA